MTHANALSLDQVRAVRAQQSGLLRPLESPEAVARALFGVQAQILSAAALSLWNRSPEPTHQSFTQRLFSSRTLIKLWGQRGTLHLYAREDWPTLIGAFAKQKTWWDRQAISAKAKADYRAALDTARRILHEKKHIGRNDLREAGISNDYLSSWGGLFASLVRAGDACHAPTEGGEGRLVSRTSWVPDLPFETPAPELANQQIARRFFAAYGPASVHDFAYWRGMNLADARPLVASLAAEFAEVHVQGASQWMSRDALSALRAAPVPRAEEWPTRLLYRFDPLLLAHKDKTWIVPEEHYKQVWRPAGHIEGLLFAHGRTWGTWRYERVAQGLEIEAVPFAPLPAELARAFSQQAEAVARFFEVPLQEVRGLSVAAKKRATPKAAKPRA